MEKTENSEKIRKVAILVFDGVQIIDFTGPYEVFGQGPFDVFTVSETGETVTTAMNMSVNPRYRFAAAPKPDILIVPGGTVHEQYGNQKVMEWVRQSAAGAEHVLSVCNGAFILAKSGLLDGLAATTFYGLIDDLRDFAPQVEVVNDRRFVDNGKIITSAGLSSGIDASLYLVGKILGPGRAQALALHLEYDWNPDSHFARAAFADRRLPSLRPIDGADIEVVKTDGDRTRWEIQYRVRTGMEQEDLFAFLRDEVGRDDAWKPDRGAGATAWVSTDDDGRVWKAGARVERDPEWTDSYLVTLTIHCQESTIVR